MKLLISVSYYFPHISGLTNSIKNLAEALAEKKYAVHVLTTQHKKSLPLLETLDNVCIERVPYALKFQKGFIMPLFAYKAFVGVKKADCVLINLPQLEGILVALYGKLLRKKVVSVYACDITLPRNPFSFIVENILFFSHFITLVLSDRVVALSDDYAKHSKLLKHFLSKTSGIYPYVKEPKISTHKSPQPPLRKGGRTEGSPPASAAKTGVEVPQDGGFKIGFIGRISSEKGVEYLLQAVPLLKEQLDKPCTLFIAGPRAVGEELYAEKIKALDTAHKDNVIFLSQLKDEELYAFYSHLDVLVLPSINGTEAFGMVQVEAMLCGTPVVATDLPGVRVPVQVSGMGRIARCKDAKDLAHNIALVLKDRKTYIKNKKEIETYFGSDAIMEKWLKVINRT